MPKPKRLSGDEVIVILARYDFRIHSRRGSHAKLKRITPGGSAQILTIPQHREMDIGTLHAIFRQASRFIPEDELRRDFFSD